MFEPVGLLFQSLLITLNRGYLAMHSWHILSLLLHVCNGVLLLFVTESIMGLVLDRADEGKASGLTRGVYRVPAFVAAAYWTLNPQRVEAVAWAAVISTPLATALALMSIACWLRSCTSPSPWFFFSWILYVAACWTNATVLPLAFVYCILDVLVVLPREHKAQQAAAAKEAGNSTVSGDSSLAFDLLFGLVRNAVFVFAWSICLFLSTVAHLQAAVTQADLPDAVLHDAGAVGVPALLSAYCSALLNPATIPSRILRSLYALSWYLKQTAHPHSLHLFQTRHVALEDESLSRWFDSRHSDEALDVVTVIALLLVLGAALWARRQSQRMFYALILSFVVVLLPSLGLGAVFIPLRSAKLGAAGSFILSPLTAPHVFVSDRAVYFASVLLAPFMAWWVVRQEVVKEKRASTAAKKAKAAASASSSAASVGPAAAGSAMLASAKSAAVDALKPQSLFHWLAPRLVLAMLFGSSLLFVLHATPEQTGEYKSVHANCAEILRADAFVVECHEILGIAAYRNNNWAAALRHLDRLEPLGSRSLVALVLRGHILAGSAEHPEISADVSRSHGSFEAALRIKPDNAYVLHNYAQAVWIGQHDGALASRLLERCISAHPQYTDAFTLLSTISRAMGDEHTADAYRNQAAQIRMHQQVYAAGQVPDASSPDVTALHERVKAQQAADLAAA